MKRARDDISTKHSSDTMGPSPLKKLKISSSTNHHEPEHEQERYTQEDIQCMLANCIFPQARLGGSKGPMVRIHSFSKGYLSLTAYDAVCSGYIKFPFEIRLRAREYRLAQVYARLRALQYSTSNYNDFNALYTYHLDNILRVRAFDEFGIGTVPNRQERFDYEIDCLYNKLRKEGRITFNLSRTIPPIEMPSLPYGPVSRFERIRHPIPDLDNLDIAPLLQVIKDLHIQVGALKQNIINYESSEEDDNENISMVDITTNSMDEDTEFSK